MLHRFPVLALLTCFAWLAACSGPHHSLGRPAAEIAIVKGSSASGLKLLGVDATIRIVAIDGQELERSSMNGYPEVVEVLPGQRRLGITYSSYVDNSPGPRGDTTLEFVAQAGQTYRIRLTGAAPATLVIEPEPVH